MILPVVVTTRNRSLRGVGSPVIYLDSFAKEITANSWEVRTGGVRVIRTRSEKRLSFSTKEFGRLDKGSVLEIEVEFRWEDVFTAYTTSPEPNYGYFAVPNECADLFGDLLDQQPSLSFFDWREDNVDLTSLSGDISEIFGLWIRFQKQEHLFSFRSCEDNSITDLRF